MKDYITGFMHEPPDKQPAVVACRTGLFVGVVSLRKDLVGRRVTVEVAIERNAGRIAGPGDGERIPFVKHIKLLK